MFKSILCVTSFCDFYCFPPAFFTCFVLIHIYSTTTQMWSCPDLNQVKILERWEFTCPKCWPDQDLIHVIDIACLPGKINYKI